MKQGETSPCRTYTESYSYTNSEWKDRLTAYNGQAITYDAIGNPLSYYNGEHYSLEWQNGRQLSELVHDGNQNLYEYNADGLRTKKTVVSDDTYRYYYSGDKLVSMVWEAGEKSLNFLYNGDAPYSVVYYDGTYSSSYFYLTDLQGDVVALMSAHHGIVAEYTYDAWGNILAVTDSLGNDISGDPTEIGNINPLRYRGYFYDTETGFYYLQSRYYDPAVGRFINTEPNADAGGYDSNAGFLAYNVYAYCANNPVIYYDGFGEFILTAIAITVGAGVLIGTGISAASQYFSTGEVKWVDAIIDGISGGISAAISTTPIGVVGSIVTNGILGASTYVAKQIINGGAIETEAIITDMVLGCVDGAIGGNGSNYKNLDETWKYSSSHYEREIRRSNTKYSYKRMAKYTAEKLAIKKKIGYGVLGSFVSSAILESLQLKV